MSSMICPVCRTEYAGWAQKCSTCAVALVLVGERIDVLSLPEELQVVYELGEWSDDQRGLLGEWMAELEVPHAWEGDDLIVAEIDEPRIDELCERIESGDIGETDVTYDLAEWEEDDRSRLEMALMEQAIDFSYETDVLVIAPKDEAAVDAIIDEISPSSASDATRDGDEPDDDEKEPLPEASAELMGDLFVAADRLQHSHEDEEGIRRLTSVIDIVDSSGPPYGVTHIQWTRIVTAADELADSLTDGVEPETVQSQAVSLRTLLRSYV